MVLQFLVLTCACALHSIMGVKYWNDRLALALFSTCDPIVPLLYLRDRAQCAKSIRTRNGETPVIMCVCVVQEHSLHWSYC